MLLINGKMEYKIFNNSAQIQLTYITICDIIIYTDGEC